MVSITDFKKIVVLTGAGISAESGLATFRDSNGLWENHRVEDVATPEAFERDPHLVWKFYSMRRIQASQAKPNIAHTQLVSFSKNHPGQMTLVTQNVDVIHERADTEDVLPIYPMHGSLNKSRCSECDIIYYDDFAYFDLKGNYAPQETGLLSEAERASPDSLHQFNLDYKNFLPLSPCCQKPIRPHIVWFGEIPLYMDKILKVLRECDLFVSIGTSGQVYPAAGFLELVHQQGGTTICINKEAIPQNSSIDHFLQGLATVEVPKFFI